MESVFNSVSAPSRRFATLLAFSVLVAGLGTAQPLVDHSASLHSLRSGHAPAERLNGVLKPAAGPSNGMAINAGVSATTLATTLLGSGVTLSGTPTFQGAAEQGGTFTNAPALVGFSSGIILSSGKVADAAFGWNGSGLPNTNEGQPGYAPLTALVGGINPGTNDAAVLSFSFIPNSSTITFKYILASAEFQCCYSSFNDPMALFINGTTNNIALLPTTPPVPVTIFNVNNYTNKSYYNKDNTTGDALPYDGETKVLTATASVNAGQVNTLTLAVADAGDHVLDTAVFIQAGSLTTATAGVPALSPIALAVLAIIMLLAGGMMLRRRPIAG